MTISDDEMKRPWYDRVGWTMEMELTSRNWEDTEENRSKIFHEAFDVLKETGLITEDGKVVSPIRPLTKE